MDRKPTRLSFQRARLSIFLLSFVALFVAAPSVSLAQDLDNVTISGRVTDQNGAIVPGATVTAVLVKTNVERSVVANDEGRYKLIQLEPGEYTVRASSSGFASEEKTNL